MTGRALVMRADARDLPLPDASVDLVITSPPYWQLRSYTDNGGHYGQQIGSEATPAEYIATLTACTAEWMRVLKPGGSLFVNLGDKYGRGTRMKSTHGTNSKTAYVGADECAATGHPKSLLGLPWRYAIAATDQLGLILRRDIIWSKPNGLPESVTDRCRSSHEYVFHLVRQPRYYAAVDEIREPHAEAWRSTGRAENRGSKGVNGGANQGFGLAGVTPREYNPLGKLPGSVWDIPSQPLTVPARLGIDHFAAFPMELPRRIILGWSPPGVCTACGEGRRPVTESAGTATRNEQGTSWNGGSLGIKGRVASPRQREIGISTTITGYACACPEPIAPTRPAIVLDPFGGTGTTSLVAAMHGRTGITVDRSADYCRLAAWRTNDPAQQAKAAGKPAPKPRRTSRRSNPGQMSLF